MAFKTRSSAEIKAETPEKLFPVLARTGENSPGLWSQQTDLLREYAANRVKTKDLAIELPTGTGKTLTGLLIADWRRRSAMGRAVFACPTVQLVRQVVAAAEREGIPAVDLSGSHKKWNPSDKSKYERARAIAVVPYGSVFNVSPKLIDADVIVFDDSHAGEQYVSSAYTVQIARWRHSDIYAAVVDAVSPALSSERHSQLIMNTPGAGSRQLVDSITLAINDDWLTPLGRALEMLKSQPAEDKEASSQSYSLSAIRDHLSSCTLYLSWDKIEIRPAVPPTFENPLFSGAQQRVYLSATLGAAGELERAFGRPKVKRLALPSEAPTPKSGRRFLVFPHLVADVDPEVLTKELIEMAGKAVVITPSDAAAEEARESIVPDDWTIFGKQDVEESFDGFAATPNSVVVLANRYDGIDLPGDTCRAVAIAGFPGATSLQEEFLSTRARARSVLDERVRSRVIQGTGRCTRGPRDWALVIVADSDTTTYLSRSEVQTSLDPDLQAEVIFGLDQSELTADEVRQNVRVFLEQGDDWHDTAEPEITSLRANASQAILPAADALREAATQEVEGLERSWHGDWANAGVATHAAATALNSHRDARGYQAVLLFRAAVAAEKASRDTGDTTLAQLADGLAAQAVAAAVPATWMNAYLPFEGRVAMPISPAFESAVEKLAVEIDFVGSTAKLQSTIDSMLDGLSSIDHADYEPALTTLGKLLGAEAFKPSGDGRTDSAWCWNNFLWLSLEAKSEHLASGTIGMDDVRQVIGHLKLVAADRGAAIPAGSAAVMISPRTTVKRDAMTLAESHTFRILPMDVLAVGREVERLWKQLHTLRNIKNQDERRPAIADAVRSAGLTPEAIQDRFTETPLSSDS
jgi:hypothetical protein